MLYFDTSFHHRLLISGKRVSEPFIASERVEKDLYRIILCAASRHNRPEINHDIAPPWQIIHCWQNHFDTSPISISAVTSIILRLLIFTLDKIVPSPPLSSSCSRCRFSKCKFIFSSSSSICYCSFWSVIGRIAYLPVRGKRCTRDADG